MREWLLISRPNICVGSNSQIEYRLGVCVPFPRSIFDIGTVAFLAGALVACHYQEDGDVVYPLNV